MTVSNISAQYHEGLVTKGEVSEEPVMLVKYSSSLYLRPAEVEVRRTRRGGESWVIQEVWVSGPRIKKDGTDSLLCGSNFYYGLDDCPEWAQKFVLDNPPPE